MLGLSRLWAKQSQTWAEHSQLASIAYHWRCSRLRYSLKRAAATASQQSYEKSKQATTAILLPQQKVWFMRMYIIVWYQVVISKQDTVQPAVFCQGKLQTILAVFQFTVVLMFGLPHVCAGFVKPALYASAVVDDMVPATFSLRGWHHLLGQGRSVSCLQLSDLSKMVSTARRTAYALFLQTSIESRVASAGAPECYKTR